jgi:predicted enzyme related to lactoylglutathione lyase
MQATQATTIRGIDISMYLVKDAERAKRFWSETMGLKMTQDYGSNGGEFTFPDGTTFGLWKMDDGSWNPGLGVVFNVDDVPAAVEHFKSRGVKFADHIEDTPVCKMAFAEDSEGNHFILHERKGGRA